MIAVKIGMGTADESKFDGVKPKLDSSSTFINSLAGSPFFPPSSGGCNSVDFLILAADKVSGTIDVLDSIRCSRVVVVMNATAGLAPVLEDPSTSIKLRKAPVAVIIFVKNKEAREKRFTS
jgi:hypothetical protein